MAAPKKKLIELVRDRTFLARRHADRLLEEPLERADLRALQEACRAADDAGARQAIAMAFERAVQNEPAAPREDPRAELDAILNAPPRPSNPARNRAATEREARAKYARGLFNDGLSIAEISARINASSFAGNASPATVRR